MFKKEDFIVDGIYGERLLISKEADQSELDMFDDPDKDATKQLIEEEIEKLRT